MGSAQIPCMECTLCIHEVIKLSNGFPKSHGQAKGPSYKFHSFGQNADVLFASLPTGIHNGVLKKAIWLVFFGAPVNSFCSKIKIIKTIF